MLKPSKKEIGKLNEQLERYNKGYGAGAFTLEQLKNYTTPLQENISQLKTQVANAKQDIQAFAIKAKKTLHDLKFDAKRAIILNTVEKIVGNRDHLQVIGYIPVNQNYVRELSLHRNRGTAECR